MNPTDIISLLSGGLGIVGVAILSLFIAGKIVPVSRLDDAKEELRVHKEEAKADLQLVRAERDEWKKTAEAERQRADAGVLAAQIVAGALQHLGTRKELEQ